MKKACVLLAPGCEEMEAVITIDVLRRGGVETVTAGLNPGVFSASRNVKLASDVSLDDLEDPDGFDVLVMPGGMPGTEALRDDERVGKLLKRYAADSNKRVASICAAALVLDANGLLEGRRFTCYPGVKDKVGSGTYVNEPVVIDGNLITSQGPGTAMAFALTLVELLTDRPNRDSVAEKMLYAG